MIRLTDLRLTTHKNRVTVQNTSLKQINRAIPINISLGVPLAKLSFKLNKEFTHGYDTKKYHKEPIL